MNFLRNSTFLVFNDFKEYTYIIKHFVGVICMNCPYCNQQMEAGYIKTPQAAQWTPAEGANPLSRWFNGVRLVGFSHITGTRVEAEYCPDCGKIIINV